MRVLSVVTDSDAIRVETFRGRNYTVVPVIALVEGVIQGLNAANPEFAPADEFAKYPAAWNGRPVTLDHPRHNGELVSANSTEMLEEYQIGFLANSERDGDKLKTEAWLDDELVEEKGEDATAMVERIKAGEEFVEVSTGLFTEVTKTVGFHNNQAYSVAWGPVVPDHLAFLPDAIGACSVANGCGAPRLNAQGETVFGLSYGAPVNMGAPADCQACAKGDPCVNTNTSQTGANDGSQPEQRTNATGSGSGESGKAPAGSPEETGSSTEGAGAGEGQQPQEPAGPTATVVTETTTIEDGVQTKETTTITGTPEEVAASLEANEAKAQTLDRIVANAVPAGMTFENIRTILQEALRQTYGANDGYSECGCYHYRYLYISALTSDQVAFERWVRGDESYQTVAVNYSITDDGGVTFTGEPVPVNLIVSITPKPAIAGGGVTVNEGLSGANQQQEEGHMTGTTTGGAPAGTEVPADTTITPPTTTGSEGAGGEQRANGAGDNPAPRTLEQYLADAPDGVREVLQEGIAMRAHQRKVLTDSIVANSNGLFAEAELTGKSMEELRKLATLSAPKADFTGRAMPTAHQNLGVNASADGLKDNQHTVPVAPKAFGRTIADTKASSSNADNAAAA